MINQNTKTCPTTSNASIIQNIYNYSKFSSMFLQVMQIEDDYISIHVVFLWKFLQKNNKFVIRNKNIYFWRKQEIKKKHKTNENKWKMEFKKN